MKKEYFFVIISVIIFSIALIAGCAGGSGGSGSGGNDPIPSPTATTTPTSTPTGSVAGTVKDGERPLYGALCSITLEHNVLSTYTNSLGEFTLNGVPEGNWYLKIEVANYDIWQQEIEVVAGETTGVSVGMDNPPPTPTEVGNLRGRVIDSSGSPVNEATVRVDVTDGRPAYYATTDSSGNYVVYNVPVGTWTMVVYKGDFSSTTTVTVVEGETVTVPDQVITPTPSPSPDPTGSPTATPTPDPTTSPSPNPTGSPTASPTETPTPGKVLVTGHVSDLKISTSISGANGTYSQYGSVIDTVETDSSGNYKVNLTPGDYLVVWRKSGYYSTSFRATVIEGGINSFDYQIEKL